MGYFISSSRSPECDRVTLSCIWRIVSKQSTPMSISNSTTMVDITDNAQSTTKNTIRISIPKLQELTYSVMCIPAIFYNFELLSSWLHSFKNMTFIFLTNVNSVLLITHWHGYTAGYYRWEASPNLWTLLQIMVWCHHTTIHYLNQCWPWLTKQCCNTRLKLLTMLAIILFTEFKISGFLIHCGPVMSYGIMIWLTLVPIMACFQTAPSHYMNQCGLIIS